MFHLRWTSWRRDLLVAFLASAVTVSVLVPVGWAAVRDVRNRAGRDLINQVVGAAADHVEGMENTSDAEVLRVAADAVAPEIPRDAHVLIDRKASSYARGDIVAFRAGDNNYLGRVVALDQAAGRITVERNGEPNRDVSLTDVLGRVLLNTR